MRIGRTMIAASCALVGAMVLALPAAAKGGQTATLSGPGIEEPIVVMDNGDPTLGGVTVDDDFPSYLHLALSDATQQYVYDLTGARSGPPPGELGPKYTLTWLMWGPSGSDADDWTVVQEIYPDHPSGPLIHTLPSHYLNGEEGWFVADELLRDTIAAYSAPATEEATPPAPAESGLAPPAVIAVVVAAFAAGLATGRWAQQRPSRIRIRRASEASP